MARASATPGRTTLRLPPMRFVVLVTVILCVMPVIALFGVAFSPEPALWLHISRFVLPYALRDTVLLACGVAVLSGVVGVALASLVSLTNFPGRKIVASAAILPLAFPIYLHAFIYVELLDAAGPVQQFMRLHLSPALRFPEIRSVWGAICIFSLVLYPYVYLPVMLALAAQSRSYRDAARVLGCTPLKAFFSVQLPAIRPAIAAGLMLALMETLADFGASEYLGVRTIAFTIYSTWTSRSSLPAAAQLALILVGAVAVLIAVESKSQNALSHQSKVNRIGAAPRMQLKGSTAAAAFGFSWSVLVIAFLIPFVFLIAQTIKRFDLEHARDQLASTFLTTGLLATASASIIIVLALVVALFQRHHNSRFSAVSTNMALLGYAIPGVVLAIGLLYSGGIIDKAIDAAARSVFGVSTGLIVTGTPLILVLAYLSRFIAVAHRPLDSRLKQIPKHLDYVARTLGRAPISVFNEVLLPLIRPTLAAAWLLLAVDITKELPMTLLLRPIGIETLATSLYGHASRGQFEDGSIEALAILLLGMLAVAVLQRLIRRGALRHL
jgi:iron(III) transport system permease protein